MISYATKLYFSVKRGPAREQIDNEVIKDPDYKEGDGDDDIETEEEEDDNDDYSEEESDQDTDSAQSTAYSDSDTEDETAEELVIPRRSTRINPSKFPHSIALMLTM